MKYRLKPLRDQVIVIMGASSGIGLCTARLAAERGARVVLAARNGDDLADVVARIRATGGTAEHVVADVTEMDQVDRVAQTAIDRFGGFDSWVNDAAVGMYGLLTELEMADKRRQFEVNFWGVVNGCRAALRHLRQHGGALINVGSVTSERALPLQGIYSASKHAVKGYTDTLRMELEAAEAPVSVTLIKPASIDTPFFEHAKSVMGVQPRPLPPVYDPEVVARAILHCCEHPERDLFVGAAAALLAAGEAHMPRLTDRYLEKTGFDEQRTDRPVEHPDGNLYRPLPDGRERGRNYEGRVMRHSAYTSARMHPVVAGLAVAGLGVALAAGLGALRARREASERRPRGDGATRDVSTPTGEEPLELLLVQQCMLDEGDERFALTRDNLLG